MRARDSELGKHTLVGQFLHVQHGDLDALLSQQVHDNLANAVTSARDDNNLLTPHVRVVGPVVGDGVVEPLADLVCQPKHEQRLQVLPRGRMVGSHASAIERVFAGEEERQSEQRVERRELDKARKGIASDAYGYISWASITQARRVVTYLHAKDSTRS